MTKPDGSYPNHHESPSEEERLSAAREGYEEQRLLVDAAANRFAYTVLQFHQLEDEFVSLIEELRRTDVHQMANLAHLEGLRLRLLTSLNDDYRHAVNELADAMFVSLGFDQE